MSTIGLLVSGHGEVHALPELVRRVLHERLDVFDVQPGSEGSQTLIRKAEGSLLKKDSDVLERSVARLARRADAVLVLIDLEDGCPATEGPALLARARPSARGKPCAVAIAYREVETWFICDAPNLWGVERPVNPEKWRHAKGWVRKHGLPGYNERADCVRLCSRLDIDVVVEHSDSFRVLVDRIEALASGLASATEEQD